MQCVCIEVSLRVPHTYGSLYLLTKLQELLSLEAVENQAQEIKGMQPIVHHVGIVSAKVLLL